MNESEEGNKNENKNTNENENENENVNANERHQVNISFFLRELRPKKLNIQVRKLWTEVFDKEIP